MKLKEIISEDFGPGFAGADERYSEEPYRSPMSVKDQAKDEMYGQMAKDFTNDRTPMSEFDVDEIKRMIMPATRKSKDLKRQADQILDVWEKNTEEDDYLPDDIFNKLFKQYEQLKDSDNESPLVLFNKVHALTKEMEEAVERFGDWSSSEDGDKWKDDNGHF